MSLYFSRGDAAVYGYFDAYSAIALIPGHGFSVNSVIEHEIVHARLIGLSALGFLEQLLRAVAVSAAQTGDAGFENQLRRYTSSILRMTEHVHEAAAWLWTEVTELREPHLHRFQPHVSEVRNPAVPVRYLAGVKRGLHLYLLRAAREQNPDGSIPAGADPRNFAQLVQVLAIWALSPPGTARLLSTDATADDFENLPVVLATEANQPVARFLHLLQWADSLTLVGIRDLFSAMENDDWSASPLPVVRRPAVDGVEWRHCYAILSGLLSPEVRSRMPSRASFSTVLYRPDVEPRAQVAVQQPFRPIGCVPPTMSSLMRRIDGTKIARLGPDRFIAGAFCLEVFDLRHRLASPHRGRAAEIHSVLADASEVHLVVASHGYRFDDLDFEDRLVGGRPHAVVANMSVRELMVRLDREGGLGNSAAVEYLVTPSGLPEEYSFVTFAAREAPHAAVVLPVAAPRPEFIVRAAEPVGSGVRVSQVHARLVDWIPRAAASVTAAWCLWEGWVSFDDASPCE